MNIRRFATFTLMLTIVAAVLAVTQRPALAITATYDPAAAACVASGGPGRPVHRDLTAGDAQRVASRRSTSAVRAALDASSGRPAACHTTPPLASTSRA